MGAARRTTIAVRGETKEQFKDAKPFESLSADEFIQHLLDEYDGSSA